MRAKDKRNLFRIIVSAALFIAVALIEHFGLLPDIIWVKICAYLVPYAVIAWDILRRAAINIAHGQVFDENFLMAIATIGAFVTGEYPEAVFVMLFYQVGELFQSIAVGKSRRSIKSLMEIKVDSAFVEVDGILCEKPCEEIMPGQIIVVKPGGRVPLDGIIVEGVTSVNTVALTGESLPRDLAVGDEILSGFVNEGGLVRVRVTKAHGESTVSRILRLVEESSANKSKNEAFITSFAKIYTPVVVIGALLLAVLPPLFLDMSSWAVWREWILRAMTFLVISCPCALVISVPLAYFGGIGGASKSGVLIKGSNYLDALSKCDTIVFDKTGTVTKGCFSVSRVCPADGVDEAYLLRVSASAEKYSDHPVARSLRQAAKDIFEPGDVKELAGRGVSALIDGRRVLVGNDLLMKENSISPSVTDGRGVAIHVSEDGRYLGYIVISDEIKPEAATAFSELKGLGVRETVMLTGDKRAEAERVALEVGVDTVHAELLPEDKLEKIKAIMAAKTGKGKTAFVGDGINDAPVLAGADVGIAMGGLGSDAAIEAADIVIMNDSLQGVSKAIRISRFTQRVATENIIFALGVKIAFLILGALGIVGLNLAVFADVGVAVLAILNSMRTLALRP